MIMDNVKGVPRELIEVSATFGLSKREILTDVILRYALPGIWDTFRITLGWAGPTGGGRMVAANVGLGYRIMKAQRFLQTESIILAFSHRLMGLATDMLSSWPTSACSAGQTERITDETLCPGT